MKTLPGNPLTLGATIHDNFVRFAIFSRHASDVWLLFFDNADDLQPAHEIKLDSHLNRTGDIWHIDVVSSAGEGQLYLYRMDGQYRPTQGHRYNRNKYLIDPYSRALVGTYSSNESEQYDRQFTDSNLPFLPKGVVIRDDFDWQGDKPLNHPLHETIIYEAHTRGLTKHTSAEINKPGTYLGIVELIPYFKKLGITAIELLPIHPSDVGVDGHINPITGLPVTNHWGYQTINFFSVTQRYAHDKKSDSPLREFKTMVRELHKAGLEVILDVVYNHTAEGDHKGNCLSFRGIDNQIYYLLEDDKRRYKNYSGVGNTLNCNHPVVRNLIVDSLHYWVVECHVDGFRFDLASVLGRDQFGNLLENPPLVERIAEDPILRDTKLIAEAWDAAGAYQVGSFPHRRWAEWNAQYRDDIRRFWRGDLGTLSSFATRLAGSSDLYLRDGRAPFHSINFITSHDGFTLNDLVSYKHKHNFANGENNYDGESNNISDNMGVEGHTDDFTIERNRVRRIKNFIATLMLSQGVPMLLAGDEFRRTQQGNNNAYAQDNEISWLDWSFKEKHGEIYDFTCRMIAFRKAHPIFHRQHFFTGFDKGRFDIQWFSMNGEEADWGHLVRTLTCLIYGHYERTTKDRPDNDALLMFNVDSMPHTFKLPPAPYHKKWRRVIDTNLLPPLDICPVDWETKLGNQKSYQVSEQSMVVLLSFKE
ncbi:MAG: glycogen debranching enzyme GlgX [Anaerolineaceae bacterium 4572_78]|nr:MAG: glycogen debranching enzyme GlgX [Anaerolineaceae bacterium 4572_78]